MEIIRRDTPDMMMLMPNNVPTTHSALIGQWTQIKTPKRIVTMASKSTHPQPGIGTHVKREHQRDHAVHQQEASQKQGQRQQTADGMHQQVNASHDIDEPENGFQNCAAAAVRYGMRR